MKNRKSQFATLTRLFRKKHSLCGGIVKWRDVNFNKSLWDPHNSTRSGNILRHTEIAFTKRLNQTKKLLQQKEL